MADWERVRELIRSESEETLLLLVMQLGGGTLNPAAVRDYIARRRKTLSEAAPDETSGGAGDVRAEPMEGLPRPLRRPDSPRFEAHLASNGELVDKMADALVLGDAYRAAVFDAEIRSRGLTEARGERFAMWPRGSPVRFEPIENLEDDVRRMTTSELADALGDAFNDPERSAPLKAEFVRRGIEEAGGERWSVSIRPTGFWFVNLEAKARHEAALTLKVPVVVPGRGIETVVIDRPQRYTAGDIEAHVRAEAESRAERAARPAAKALARAMAAAVEDDARMGAAGWMR